MRNLLFVIFATMLLVGCATAQRVAYEEALNIHDVFYAEEEPESYFDCKKIDGNSFNYGDEPFLVVRFGGLMPDEENKVYWAVAVDVYYNGVAVGRMGPKFFHGDLDDEGADRDRYVVKVPLVMAESLEPGLFRFDISILDGITYQTVYTSIELSLLPKVI